MIALDSQLFSVVEDEGFRRLIIDQDIHCQAKGTCSTKCVILNIFTELKAAVRGEIDSVAHVSFITDGVQASVMNLSSASQLTG